MGSQFFLEIIILGLSLLIFIVLVLSLVTVDLQSSENFFFVFSLQLQFGVDESYTLLVPKAKESSQVTIEVRCIVDLRFLGFGFSFFLITNEFGYSMLLFFFVIWKLELG